MESWTDLKNKKIKIWANGRDDKILYSTSIAKKNKDGQYDKKKLYITVNIPQDKVIQNDSDVVIKEGWFTFFLDQNGYAKPLIVIREFDVLGEVALEEQDPEESLDSLFDNDSPF